MLGLVTLGLSATIGAIAAKARAEVERQVGVRSHTAADPAREVLKFRGTRLASADLVIVEEVFW
jgi:hypothetical protein